MMRAAAFVAVLAQCFSRNAAGSAAMTCPEDLEVKGYGAVKIVPTGWKNPNGFSEVQVKNKTEVVPIMGGRAYWAESCTAGEYNNTQYTRAKLLGRTMRFTIDLTGAGCGCNAAFYLTSMGHNTHESECFDYYCDANNVCGQSCAEIDIMEANQHAWHSTLHTAYDKDGAAAGFGGGGEGWNGPRNWTEKDYGLGGKCIDTKKPFDVEVSFPVDKQGTLLAMQVTLEQEGTPCPLAARISNYAGMSELTKALSDGMTPIVSYWADDDMLWMDGEGNDGQGPCRKDKRKACADFVKMYNFSLEKLKDEQEQETIATRQNKVMEKMLEKLKKQAEEKKRKEEEERAKKEKAAAQQWQHRGHSDSEHNGTNGSASKDGAEASHDGSWDHDWNHISLPDLERTTATTTAAQWIKGPESTDCVGMDRGCHHAGWSSVIMRKNAQSAGRSPLVLGSGLLSAGLCALAAAVVFASSVALVARARRPRQQAVAPGEAEAPVDSRRDGEGERVHRLRSAPSAVGLLALAGHEAV